CHRPARECLGLGDDQVTTRLQFHTSAEIANDVIIDVEQIKDGPLTTVVLQLVHRVGHELAGKSLQQAKLLFGIYADGLCVCADQVAQHSLHEAQVFMQ